MLIAWICSMFNIFCNQPASALSPNFQSEQLCSALNSSRLLSWPRAVASGCSLIPAIASHKIYHMFLTRNHQKHWSTPWKIHGFWWFIIIYHHLSKSSKTINNHYVSSSKKQKLINNHYSSSFTLKNINNHLFIIMYPCIKHRQKSQRFFNQSMFPTSVRTASSRRISWVNLRNSWVAPRQRGSAEGPSGAFVVDTPW